MKKIFVPAYLKKDPLSAVEKALYLLEDYDRIGLLTTAQHLNSLQRVMEFLQSRDKSPVEGGQILGCNQENAQRIEGGVDCFLFIGSGRFHPLWVAIQSKKPVFIANPYSDSADRIKEEEKKRYIKKRRGRIMKALEAEIFGVIISTKTGQFDIEKAAEIKNRLISLGKEVFLFAGSEINPGNLLPFKVDAWVNTACPRIVDDVFDKPVINPQEMDILEGLLKGSESH